MSNTFKQGHGRLRWSAWLGVWKRAFIVATLSAPLCMFLGDRYPWIVAVPITVGTIWHVWAELRGDVKTPNDQAEARLPVSAASATPKI